MPDERHIVPVTGPVTGIFKPPGSKSITNRALICAALANGSSTIRGALDSDDTRVMLESLNRLGFRVSLDTASCTVLVEGRGGAIPNQAAELEIGNSGTSVRFLTAMLAMAGGSYQLDGVPRMRQRPIGPLVNALQQFGVKIKAVSPNDCPPVIIEPGGTRHDSIDVSGNLSSQYLSGLLMAAPQLNHDLSINIEGRLVSVPYVDMTIEVMRSFGVHVEVKRNQNVEPVSFFIDGQQTYSATNFDVEPDASAASYFLALPAILGGSVRIAGLGSDSLQGDVRFVDCLESMGCDVRLDSHSVSVAGKAVNGIDVDMANISDTVQTLAAVAVFVDGPTTIRNVAHNRVKETDRIGNLVIELRKLGIDVEERDDGLTIHPGPLHPATFATYDDHRMAMSFSLIGLRQQGIVIENPGCVSKTYPKFFEDLQAFVCR